MKMYVRFLIGLTVLAFTPVSAHSHQAPIDAEPAKNGVFAGDLQLCADSVEAASVRPEENTGRMVVSIILQPEAALAFGEMTGKLVGKALPITVDGKVIISPTVHEPIFGGAIQISGATTEEQSKLVTAFTEPC